MTAEQATEIIALLQTVSDGAYWIVGLLAFIIALLVVVIFGQQWR